MSIIGDEGCFNSRDNLITRLLRLLRHWNWWRSRLGKDSVRSAWATVGAETALFNNGCIFRNFRTMIGLSDWLNTGNDARSNGSRAE
jgi:hypothetical protein